MLSVVIASRFVSKKRRISRRAGTSHSAGHRCPGYIISSKAVKPRSASERTASSALWLSVYEYRLTAKAALWAFMAMSSVGCDVRSFGVRRSVLALGMFLSRAAGAGLIRTASGRAVPERVASARRGGRHPAPVARRLEAEHLLRPRDVEHRRKRIAPEVFGIADFGQPPVALAQHVERRSCIEAVGGRDEERLVRNPRHFERAAEALRDVLGRD